jgi:hypothetical protein
LVPLVAERHGTMYQPVIDFVVPAARHYPSREAALSFQIEPSSI